MSTYTYRKRVFLSPISTGFTSYIFVEAETSDNGEYKQGNYIVILADCRRRIELEFFLGTARHRKQSKAKINKLIDILTRFKDALDKESQLIEDYESQPPKSKTD